MPLFFRYLSSKTPLTPLYQYEPPLTPLAFRLNAINAVIPEKSAFMKNLFFYVMKNQKLMVNQKNFRHKVAKLLKQLSLAIVVNPMELGIWAWMCPYWDSSAIHRWSWHSKRPPSMVMAIPGRPSLASDGSAMVHRW